MKGSVIVPVYNVYKYLDKCLNSLVNQTLKDIEIIIVNDGSKENEEEIINKYLDKYSNIKYYKKENGGLSSARNYGILKSTGKFICFVDSDDYVELNTYELLYNKMISGNYDVVDCNIIYDYGDRKIKVSSNGKDTSNIKELMPVLYPAAWNKLYKKELFDDCLYKEGIWYEDVEILFRLFPKIKSFGHIDNYLINYVQRENAITKTYDKRLWNYIDNFNTLIEFYKNNNYYLEYYKELEYSYVRYLYATFIKQARNLDFKNYKLAVCDAIINVKKNFPNYRKNKYFYSSIKGIYLVLFNKLLAYIMYYLKGVLK